MKMSGAIKFYGLYVGIRFMRIRIQPKFEYGSGF